MTFREYLQENAEAEFDMIIGDVEMPATVVWNEDMQITEYFEEKYSQMLNSTIEIHEDPKGKYTTCIELLDETISSKKGEEFVWALAGYCSTEEYDKLIGTQEG